MPCFNTCSGHPWGCRRWEGCKCFSRQPPPPILLRVEKAFPSFPGTMISRSRVRSMRPGCESLGVRAGRVHNNLRKVESPPPHRGRESAWQPRLPDQCEFGSPNRTRWPLPFPNTGARPGGRPILRRASSPVPAASFAPGQHAPALPALEWAHTGCSGGGSGSERSVKTWLSLSVAWPPSRRTGGHKGDNPDICPTHWFISIPLRVTCYPSLPSALPTPLRPGLAAFFLHTNLNLAVLENTLLEAGAGGYCKRFCFLFEWKPFRQSQFSKRKSRRRSRIGWWN